MKRMMLAALFIISTAVVLSACGGNGSEISQVSPQETEERVSIAIVDSIGIELGDSNYVFANIMAVEYGPDGNIYVLDRGTYSLPVYSSDGEFIRRIANQGSGPGELMMPLAMALLGNGRIAICDPMQRGINTFTPEGQWEGVSMEFNNNPPMRMTGADSNAFVALKITIAFEEEPTTSFIVGRYEDIPEPTAIYYEDEFPFNPEDLTEILNRTMFSTEYAADRNGNVYLTPMSTEDYIVRVFDRDGNMTLEFQREVDRVEKSEDEIAEEKRWMEAWLTSIVPQGVLIDYDPNPYRYMTTDIGYDSQNRIWVRRGTELVPVFDVYDMEGELLFIAEVEGAGEDAQYWDFMIDEHGMLAYSLNPELFHKIWIMELP
ncbi:MAG: 6-bladed beta-propeller [Candidatus Aegiribacteria sp.]|nr:6-bladed beta-propeller [Candidatus Aegiribacteria sp.]